jgi:beta-galactosidase
MKQMGANGYRTSHYPQAEALMDALDENGFIVMAETRWFDSSDEGKAQLEMLMKRDRNHPSVIIWSLGNEENDIQNKANNAHRVQVQFYIHAQPRATLRDHIQERHI